MTMYTKMWMTLRLARDDIDVIQKDFRYFEEDPVGAAELTFTMIKAKKSMQAQQLE